MPPSYSYQYGKIFPLVFLPFSFLPAWLSDPPDRVIVCALDALSGATVVIVVNCIFFGGVHCSTRHTPQGGMHEDGQMHIQYIVYVLI